MSVRPSEQRLRHLRDLTMELVARDIRLRYHGSLLGVAWTLLNPMAELLVLLFVFTRILPLDIPNYSAFLFTGLIVYSWFQTSLFLATGAIVDNRDLIRRPGIPSAVLPVVTVASNLLHFLFALPVLFAMLLLTGVPFSSAMLLLPLLVAVQFVFILSLAYPVATLHVWYRDTQHVLRIGLQLLFYLTPVFYDARAVPERFRGVYAVNPMALIIEGYRDVLMRGRVPDLFPLLLVTAASGAVLCAGLLTFRRASHRFADEL